MVRVGIGQIDIAEEIEETFSFNQLGDYSLLSSLLILLFFLDLFHSKILADPFDDGGFGFHGCTILEIELLGQLCILDELIFSQ